MLEYAIDITSHPIDSSYGRDMDIPHRNFTDLHQQLFQLSYSVHILRACHILCSSFVESGHIERLSD